MWMSLVTVALIPAQADSAEAQFKKMEQAVLKAKALQADVHLVAGADKDAFMDLKGRIVIAPGAKLRLELEGEVRKEKDKMTMVSDGSQMIMSSSKQPGKSQKAEKHLTEMTLASIARSGITVALFFVSERSDDKKDDEFSVDKFLAVSDFKLGKKEAIDGKDAQAIEYKLKAKSSKEPMDVTVWIDVKSGLPVKRVATANEGAMKVTITETYGKMTLDGKIDDKEFVLPK
jgi:outer membrane lipoprotein-sorting protein